MTLPDKDAILNEALSKRPFKVSSLPNIVEERSWSQEMLESFEDWMKSLFHSKGPNINLQWLENVFKFIPTLLYILGGLGVIYIFYRLYVSQILNRKPKFRAPISATSKTQSEDLSMELGNLIRSEKYREALRLRWKLFLKEMRFSPSITPSDLNESKADISDQIEIKGRQLNNIYKMMFSTVAPSKDEMEKYFRIFSLIEEENIEAQS